MAPLLLIPVITTPFQCTAINIVGWLPRTPHGNILNMIVYGSRFTDARPLWKTTEEVVRTALFDMLSVYGTPKEILSDQMSNFLSQTMKELCKLLDITQIKTSPYHPQTNGAFEWFHGTLKSMPQNHKDEKWGWDALLSPWLFAYREVPNASTCLLPFNLVFGHQVKAPLDILQWLLDGFKVDWQISFRWVEEIWNKIEQMQGLAVQNQRGTTRRRNLKCSTNETRFWLSWGKNPGCRHTKGKAHTSSCRNCHRSHIYWHARL